MKSSQIIAVVIAIVGVMWIGSGVLFSGKDDGAKSGGAVAEAEAEAQKNSLVQVRVRDIMAQEYQDTVTVTGRTQGSRTVDLAGEISAQVTEVIKDKGHLAKEGDILAKLEVKDRAARLKEAEGRYKQRQIEYNAAKNLENRGFNSKVRLAQSAADLEAAMAELQSAKIEFEKTDIIAPFDGVVDGRVIEIGDFVNIGDNLFRIVDLDPLEIVAFISEHDVQDIKLGGKASINFLDGSKYEGTVSFIASEADNDTRTFRVEISLPNPDLTIKAGLTAEVEIEAMNRKIHKISPSALALNDMGQIGVKIVEADDIVVFKPIEIVADKPDAMWIDGLPEKSRIITVGQHFVLEGQKVKPVLAKGDGLL